MITLYSFADDLNSKKARDWLTSNDLFFIERNLFNRPLSLLELKTILRLSENGFQDILWVNSKIYRVYYNYINDMSFPKLLSFISKHPTILKTPIIIDDKRMLAGYDENEIRCFIPRHIRKQRLAYATLMLDLRKLYA